MVLYILVEEDNDNNYVSFGLTITFIESLLRCFFSVYKHIYASFVTRMRKPPLIVFVEME